MRTKESATDGYRPSRAGRPLARRDSGHVRPGLAGTGTASFESVNYPGCFLRHANYDFQLVRNDGTAQFAAVATFRVTS